MKKIVFEYTGQVLRLSVIFIVLFLGNTKLYAQDRSDNLLIKEAVLNYIEGLEYNDPARVAKAMHEDLAKRNLGKKDDGNDYLQNMTAESLIGYAKTFDYTQLYKKGIDQEIQLQVDVEIYDIRDNIATVKAVQNKFAFFDYIHLAKINDQWKIINILWAWTE